MSGSVRPWLATLVSVGVGGVFGAGLYFAASAAPLRSGAPRPAVMPTPFLTVLDARGPVWAAPDGITRLGLTAGDQAVRYGTFGVGSGRARAVVDLPEGRLALFDEARAVVAARNAPIGVGRGGALLYASRGGTLSAPHRRVSVRGELVGLSAERGRATVAVLSTVAEVLRPGTEPVEVRGPAFVDPRRMEPRPISDRLEVRVVEILRRRGSTRIIGETAPEARVEVRLGRRQSVGWADADGRFAVSVRGTRGEPEVEVADALGRWAGPGAPSASLEELVDELSDGRMQLPPPASGAAAAEATEGVAETADPSPRKAAPRRGSGGRPAAPRSAPTRLPAPAPTQSPLGRRDGTPEPLRVDIQPKRRVLPPAPTLTPPDEVVADPREVD